MQRRQLGLLILLLLPFRLIGKAQRRPLTLVCWQGRVLSAITKAAECRPPYFITSGEPRTP
jgi:hypothetical protein